MGTEIYLSNDGEKSCLRKIANGESRRRLQKRPHVPMYLRAARDNMLTLLPANHAAVKIVNAQIAEAEAKLGMH